MKLRPMFPLAIVVFSLVMSASSAAVPAGKIEFQGFLLPDNVLLDSLRTMTLCLANQGSENELIRADDDHLTLSLPLGPASSDLEADGTTLGCVAGSADWNCSVELKKKKALLELSPYLDSVVVKEASTICFDITGLRVNSAPGISFSELEQFIDPKRANSLKLRPLVVLKSVAGTIEHDDLADVRNDQHHARYTDAEAQGAAGPHFGGSHSNLVGVTSGQHHARYTNAEAISDVGPHFGGSHGNLVGVTSGQHHARYTNVEAISDVGPHFSGSHNDLTSVVPGQHHTRYANTEAVAAVGPHFESLFDFATGCGSTVIPSGTTRDMSCTCPEGTQAFSVGWEISSTSPLLSLDDIHVTVLKSHPSSDRVWDFKIRVEPETPIAAGFRSLVYCLNAKDARLP